jgi:glycosidase
MTGFARDRFAALFQLNTRVRLAELSAALGRPATLDDVSERELDALAAAGFGAVWLLGVWQTGERSRAVSRTEPAWNEEFRRVLPDLREADICGSCFAVQAYRVHHDFGGDAALARLRARLAARGLLLLLDFVPNHVALDHPWLDQHPEFFIAGDPALLAGQPERYVRVESRSGPRVLAYGRDPNFPGWPDTLQLNYANPALQAAMIDELSAIATRCDGVRCDMAMLLLPEVFQRTWGNAPAPFWPAAIAAARQVQPGFVFVAEAYWDLEWALQQQGFDYTYDKRLYDRLVAGDARALREHLGADSEFQARLVRFLENHDEARAAAAFSPERHRAAAVLCYFAPGLRLFHQGQREGKRIRIPTHLGRGPSEPEDPELTVFYTTLQRALHDTSLHHGAFQLLAPRPAWPGNASHEAFITFLWSGPARAHALVVVNYTPHAAQCYVPLPSLRALGLSTLRLRDQLSDAVYQRSAAELEEPGLFLDLPAWGHHVFALRPA